MFKRLLWIVIPVGALVALWLWSQSQPVPVDVAEIVRGPIRSFVEEEGKTRVIDRYVVSSPVGGRLLRIDLEAGDEVAEGAIVARVDPLALKSAVATTEAEILAIRERIQGVDTKKPKADEIARAKILEDQANEALVVARHELERWTSTWERLEREHKRLQVLADQKILSASELDAAQAAATGAHEQVQAQEVRVKIANLAISATRLNRTVLEARLTDYDWEAKAYQQQIAALEASLGKLKDDLDRTVIRAPVGGRVLRLVRKSEQVVQPGTAVLEIGRLEDLEVEAEFLSEDAAHMTRGMKVEIFGRALGDRVLTGHIERIHPSAFEKISSLGVEQQRVKVIIAFASEGSGLGDLFRVEARVILEEREGVTLVPEGALFREKGAWHVFVVQDGRAVLRAVRTGLRDGRAREVLDGLEPGDRVILHPGDALEVGTRVRAIADGS